MRAWLVAALCLASLPAAAACRDTTPFLAGMETGRLVLSGPDRRTVELEVRVADDHRERSAGFQHICPATIESTSIYFLFEQPRRPNFHMRNVTAPLDIAFIDRHGEIVDIQRMQPYVLGAARETYYQPPGEVAAALETRAGYFAEAGITTGDWSVERADD